MNVSRQIGWSNESNLLYQILKQLNKLAGVLSSLVNNSTPKYKVYTALLTQSGGDDVLTVNSGNLTIGVTYFINDTQVGMDFTNVGAPNNDVGTYFVATGTTPNSWGIDVGAGVLNYNTAAPTVTVLENTIGNIWFTYNNVGVYTIKSNSLFTTNKTTFFMGIMDNNVGQPIIGTDHFANDESTYQFIITDQSGGFQNEFLYNSPIEIRVYN